ncbi:outer membrane protein [Manganibacter manganicus]|uniref:Outer membrane protein beta-barrel domain-containing protein n=1 Tax=Manganibacter manganicus TaxID=1873176 RepID=A0A1V8RNF7_9HYPH|nr:outer membrane protein [Pseudaminobacter manganicus]OQM74674.1 hypothetical protein BFN67_20735 [Pseudaminobacter manganicus]
MKKLGTVAAALALSAGPAAAQDAVYDWSGAYVGAQIGYGWGKSTTNADIVPPWKTYIDLDDSGVLGGLYAGYNYQMSNKVVLGIEADINATNVKDASDDWTLSIGGTSGTLSNFIPTSFKMSWNGAVRGRIGYAVGRFLPYIAGGVSFGGYKISLEDKGVSTHRSTLVGWNIGAGLGYAVTDNVTLRAEYRFTDLGSDKFSAFAFPAKFDLKTHDLRLGIAYKF